MSKKSIGCTWLKDRFGLHRYSTTHNSYEGTRSRIEISENGTVSEFYAPHYTPEDSPLAHLEFALKYDDLSFDFFRAVFENITAEDTVKYIQQKPRGSYERRIGFLFEFLTRQKLSLPDQPPGNYIDLIDPEKYVTGKVIKNRRWNINDNLLGDSNFCPIIRRTTDLENVLQEDYKKMVEVISQAYPPDIFYRAVHYLYTKETRSSYQIENEKPTPERINRFVKILERAGEQTVRILLSEVNLTHLQNEIVDPRFALKGYRDFQNYIGQTLPNYTQLIHYICPPPEYLRSMMDGLGIMADKSNGVPPVVRATIIAFGFVFAHPFEDGNGRIHRFLIHDVLTRDKVVPLGMIIPVSAHMVNHIKEYDTALETFSAPLMGRIKYEMGKDQSLSVSNAQEVESYFRYPDLTTQSIYLANTIKGTIEEDIQWEMEFLVKYDEVKSAIQEIVDMPDKDTDLMIKFLHQNKGVLATRKRKNFEKLTDPEIAKMESAFKEIFNIPLPNNLSAHG